MNIGNIIKNSKLKRQTSNRQACNIAKNSLQFFQKKFSHFLQQVYYAKHNKLSKKTPEVNDLNTLYLFEKIQKSIIVPNLKAEDI